MKKLYLGTATRKNTFDIIITQLSADISALTNGGKMMADIRNTIVARSGLYEKFNLAMKAHRLFYIGCHTGWGKTIAVLDWLKQANKPYAYATADSDTFFEDIQTKAFCSSKWIVLDDLFLITEAEDQNRLMEYLSNSKARFLLISRTDLPAWLKPFYMIKQLACFGWTDLAFSLEEMLTLFDDAGVSVNRADAAEILQITAGHPLALSLLSRRLQSERYSAAVVEKGKQDLFDCFDYALFQRWDSKLQTFLMEIAILDDFTDKLASMVTGRYDTEKMLATTVSIGSFLSYTPPNEYRFDFPIFKDYLLHKQKQLLSAEHIQQLYQNAGLYYELTEDILHALSYYSLAGNQDKLCALLIENSKRHAGNAHFYDTEKYYLSLSPEQIRQSPELMCGMCMLYSLRCNPEESEKWYAALETFSNSLDKKDSRYKPAKETLMYLNIALPHRGSRDMIGTMGRVAALCISGNLSLQEISVTGNLPSLLNGGKDFSEWTKIDKKLYLVMKKPVEIALGKCAVGLADTALGESLYSKCTDLYFTEALSYLNNGMSQAMLKGTVQMQFAVAGIMARAFIAQGSIDTAKTLICSFKDRLVDDKDHFLLPNINALLAQYDMYQGNLDGVDAWMRLDAPNELDTFHILSRFRYIIKVRAYIIDEKYMEAMSLLNMLKIYYERYDRPYGVMQSRLLLAIVLYRMKDAKWQEELLNLLHQSEEYGFTRLVADEGMAALEPLTKLSYDGDKDYYSTLVTLTRQQAVLYPTYLTPRKKMSDDLTALEKTVLRLIAQGMKNEEIAGVLGVTVRTVKFHSGNIYAKLGVHNRTQAIKMATENGLV